MKFGKPDADETVRSGSTMIDRRQFLSGSAAVAIGGVLAATTSQGAQAATGSVDRIVINGLDASDVTEEFIELLRQGGVHCTLTSLGGPSSYGSLLRFVDLHAKDVTIAKTAGQILQARRDGKIALLCGSQAASGYIQNVLTDNIFQSKHDKIADALRTNYELGMRTQGIVYNVGSVFGGGCLEPRMPLTRAGRRLVEEVHKLRILLDVGGHTGEQTSLDALAISAGVPVVCTHTNVAALNPNPRATSDRVFEAIAKTGGVIGVTAISDFHVRSAKSITEHGPRSPQATLDVHLDQYDHLKRLVGIDHVGLGTDHIWPWGDTEIRQTTDDFVFPPETMSEGAGQVVRGFENISKLPNVEQGLARRGWSKVELDKLMGANWLRVYKSVWGA